MSKYVIALYMRLSVEDSKTESLSIKNQQMLLRRYAETVIETTDTEILEFVDNGESGTNYQRPAVQKLLEQVRSNSIDCIIVKDFSRFGRNSIETGYFIERVFPLFRTRFISVEDQYDSDKLNGDTGGIEVNFKFLIHEYYSKDLSEKIKSAKHSKMLRGEHKLGICPYGYMKNKANEIVIDEEAANVVRMIFALSIAGNNSSEIAKALYDKKILTPGEYKASKRIYICDISRSRNMWHRSTVLQILNDERYIGTYIMGKHTQKEVGSRKTYVKDESEWIKIPDHHEAIIDKITFDNVKNGLRHFKSEKKKINDYPLKYIVYCGCCDHAMKRMIRKNTVFSCGFTVVDETAPCRKMEISENELEVLLFTIISKQAKIITAAESTGVENDNVYSEKTEYERQIRKYNNEKKLLYERYILNEIDVNEYRELKTACDVELYDLERVHSNISSHISQLQNIKSERMNMGEALKIVLNETVLNKEIVSAFINKVNIYPDKHIEIEWVYPDFAPRYHDIGK